MLFPCKFLVDLVGHFISALVIGMVLLKVYLSRVSKLEGNSNKMRDNIYYKDGMVGVIRGRTNPANHKVVMQLLHQTSDGTQQTTTKANNNRSKHTDTTRGYTLMAEHEHHSILIIQIKPGKYKHSSDAHQQYFGILLCGFQIYERTQHA